MYRYIVIFPNTHQVIKAELTLKPLLEHVNTIPTPQDLSKDCGVSLLIESDKSKNELTGIFKDNKLEFLQIVSG